MGRILQIGKSSGGGPFAVRRQEAELDGGRQASLLMQVTWRSSLPPPVKRMPHMGDAGDYSSTMHYLKAVEAAGIDDAKAVMAKMREMPINDFFAKNGRIREDGRMVHDMYVYEVKKPQE